MARTGGVDCHNGYWNEFQKIPSVRGWGIVPTFQLAQVRSERKVAPMTLSSPNAIEIKLDRLIDDMRLLRSQMIAFDRYLKGIEACLKRTENSPRANRDHGSRLLLARRLGQFYFVRSRSSNRRSLALSGNLSRQRDRDLRVNDHTALGLALEEIQLCGLAFRSLLAFLLAIVLQSLASWLLG